MNPEGRKEEAKVFLEMSKGTYLKVEAEIYISQIMWVRRARILKLRVHIFRHNQDCLCKYYANDLG